MTSTSSGRSAKRPGAERARRRRPHRPRPPRELREAGLVPKKSLGQHFLVDPRALRRIANACELDGETDVLEIGPGLGGLTAELASRARRVVAIELDDALSAYLKQRYTGTNVSVINADALDIDFAQLQLEAGQYVIAGNLPYSIAQPLLRHFLESQTKPKRIVAMVQAEVAESIVAKPGEMSLLGVSVRLFGEPRLLFRLAPSAFYPPPRVRSAVVCIEVPPQPRVAVDTEAFFRVVRAGFSTKRKQLRNALANGLAIDGAVASDVLLRAGVEPTLRAQALELEQWASIARAWTELGALKGTE